MAIKNIDKAKVFINGIEIGECEPPIIINKKDDHMIEREKNLDIEEAEIIK